VAASTPGRRNVLVLLLLACGAASGPLETPGSGTHHGSLLAASREPALSTPADSRLRCANEGSTSDPGSCLVQEAPTPERGQGHAPSQSEAPEPKSRPPAGGRTFSLWWENDSFLPRGQTTDRFYTNGVRLAWNWSQPPGWLITSCERLLPFLEPMTRGATAQYALLVGQNLYAPEDLEAEELIPDDRPYAGWLYGGFSVTAERVRSVDVLELDVGVVGPWALGEEVQTAVHKLINSRTPGGWDNQLANELGVLLAYSRAQRVLEIEDHDVAGIPGRRFMDLHLNGGGMLGNVFTNLSLGASLRLGLVSSQYGPSGLIPAAPVRQAESRWDAYLFAGVEGRAVVHNIFLDGNTFASSHRVAKRSYVSDLQVGILVRVPWHGLTVAYRAVWRSPEFDERPTTHRFGSFTVSFDLGS
jgi:hypothetical protein